MNNRLIKFSGEGPIILLIHGWGMNRQVWTNLGEQLEQYYTVGYVDLPGHGDVRHLAFDSLSQVAALLAAQIKVPVSIVGWSLGGLVAQVFAMKYPELCKKLLLIASTVSFKQRENWLCAMPEDIMEKFQSALESDFEKTVKQFLALQFIGTKNSKQFSRQFHDAILKFPPAPQALRQGMTLLLETDLRAAGLNAEMSWLFGAKDRIVPVSAAKEIARIYPQSQIDILPDAGHAPFISEPETVLSIFQTK